MWLPFPDLPCLPCSYCRTVHFLVEALSSNECLPHYCSWIMVYLPLWNNLSFLLSDALMLFFFFSREYHNLQLKYILQSTIFPKDGPALSLPPPFLHLFLASTPFFCINSAAPLAFTLHSPMLSKGIHKFVQGKGRQTLIQVTAWGKKGEG